MAIGNTFGATALSSYGGFWLSFAVVLTPGGFEIMTTLESEGGAAMYYNSFGLYLMVSAHSLTCFPSQLNTPANIKTGMVHLHHYPALLYSPFHRGLLLPLPLPGLDLLVARCRLHPA